MPSTVISASHVETHVIFTKILGGKKCHYVHYTKEETEAQKG